MLKKYFLISLANFLVCTFLAGNGKYILSKPGKLLFKENFDRAGLPELFTVGQGAWEIVDGTLRGRQLAEDNHTAFRKIYLDHHDVIYEYDIKLEGEGFHSEWVDTPPLAARLC